MGSKPLDGEVNIIQVEVTADPPFENLQEGRGGEKQQHTPEC